MRSALDYFYARLSPGAFLIVHDYSSLAWGGAERAVDEFFADKPEAVVPMPDGSGSVVIRKARAGGSRSNWRFKRKCAALSTEWASAGQDRLRDLLGEGWSGPEAWGVWGVGPRHLLELAFEDWPGADVVLEADVATALVGTRQAQSIDIVIDGQPCATWHFSRDNNRGIRRLRIPASSISRGDYPTVVIEFRPNSAIPMKELDPATTEPRPLGLGLHSLRRRSVPHLDSTSP